LYVFIKLLLTTTIAI